MEIYIYRKCKELMGNKKELGLFSQREERGYLAWF
jgi:hypothetical protein